jgi:hypothetical protein
MDLTMMERVGDRWEKMEGSCSTGQSPQWAVVPVEEEEFRIFVLGILGDILFWEVVSPSYNTQAVGTPFFTYQCLPLYIFATTFHVCWSPLPS